MRCDEPWLQPLAGHLPANRARRFAAVRHLADLFDRYALHRPELVRAGRRGGRALAGASCGGGCTRGSRSPIRRRGSSARARGCAPSRSSSSCRSGSRCSGSRGCPRASCRSCARWPTHRDVHLFLLHPSPALWERIAALGAARRRAAPRTRRRRWPRNRLLASWGQDARELQLVLGPDVDDARAPGRAPRPARCSRGCRPTVRDATGAAPEPAARRRRAASRSTPATAARARSRSCATRSCTCSRRTRRSSRAT